MGPVALDLDLERVAVRVGGTERLGRERRNVEGPRRRDGFALAPAVDLGGVETLVAPEVLERFGKPLRGDAFERQSGKDPRALERGIRDPALRHVLDRTRPPHDLADGRGKPPVDRPLEEPGRGEEEEPDRDGGQADVRDEQPGLELGTEDAAPPLEPDLDERPAEDEEDRRDQGDVQVGEDEQEQTARDRRRLHFFGALAQHRNGRPDHEHGERQDDDKPVLFAMPLQLGDEGRAARRRAIGTPLPAHFSEPCTLKRFDFFQSVRESTGMMVKT